MTKGMNSSRHSWWVGFKVGVDVFDVCCLFSWRGSRQMMPHET